jgi:hypothetical protein
MKKVFYRFLIMSCASMLLAVNVFAAAAQDAPSSPNSLRKGVPSLERLALQAIIKMEKERGGRVPPGTLPRTLEQALENERRLQQKAFKIIAYRERIGAIGRFLHPVERDGRAYQFVYIHPNSSFFNKGMTVDQTYVCPKLRPYKASVLGGLIAAVDYQGADQPTPDNTLFAVSGDLLPQ